MTKPQGSKFTQRVFYRLGLTMGAIAAIATLGCLTSDATLPLQSGSYWGGGSRYITIVRGNNRLCYQGSSRPGQVVIASLVPFRDNPTLYSIHGFPGAGIKQQSKLTLLFGTLNRNHTALSGSLPYQVEGPATLTNELRRCLNASDPFHQQIASSR